MEDELVKSKNDDKDLVKGEGDNEDHVEREVLGAYADGEPVTVMVVPLDTPATKVAMT